MKTFEELVNENVSKKAQELLSREREKHKDGTHIVLYNGQQELRAAEELVKRGHAERITRLDGSVGGEYYNNNFGRGVSRKRYVPIGTLHFKDSV